MVSSIWSVPYCLWEIPEREFPVRESAAEKMRFAVRYAVLAPSGHNSQPWLFRVADKGLELWADNTELCRWSTRKNGKW